MCPYLRSSGIRNLSPTRQVTRAAMSEAFPDMPVQQLNLIFRQTA